MDCQVEVIARERELAKVLVHKLTHFGSAFHSRLVAGLCDISKRPQGRAEMVDLIEV